MQRYKTIRKKTNNSNCFLLKKKVKQYLNCYLLKKNLLNDKIKHKTLS